MHPALTFIVVVAIGFGTAGPGHVGVEAGGAGTEERRNGDQSRILPSLAEYAIKGESEYSNCPEGYPSFGTLGDLLTAWNPNQPEVPEGGVIERLKVRSHGTWNTARAPLAVVCRRQRGGVRLPEYSTSRTHASLRAQQEREVDIR